jgi:hypothetical protein
MRWTRQRRARKYDRRAGSPVTDRGAQTNDVVAYGKTVWSWHPLLVSSRRRFLRARPGLRKTVNSPTTVTRRIRRRGEHGISRKTIVRGMSGCSDCTCMLVCVFLCTYCTRDRGCSKHPAFPAPSIGRRILLSTRVQCAAGMRRRVCPPSLRAKRSNPSRSEKEAIHLAAKRKYGLLRCARNDVDRSAPSPQSSSPAHAGDPVFQRCQ